MCKDDTRAYLDTATIDWAALRSATIEVRYGLRYEYPGPIADVHQILMLLPADCVGSQTLLTYDVRSEPVARPRYSSDRFGNRVCQLALPHVDSALEFCVVLQVKQRGGTSVPLAPGVDTELFLGPSPLTEPSPELSALASDLTAGSHDGQQSAERINGWVHDHLTYVPGATDVSTTAQDALEQRRGVCQDYSHLMIALCRLAGLPARYVSGHLLGEGVMHAWVQVLLPDLDGLPTWQSFDPLHNRRAGMTYVTIAVGRDYGDVSPTRGSYRAPYSGWLAESHKQAGVLHVEGSVE